MELESGRGQFQGPMLQSRGPGSRQPNGTGQACVLVKMKGLPVESTCAKALCGIGSSRCARLPPQEDGSLQIESVSTLCLLAVLCPLACHISSVPSHLSLCLSQMPHPQATSRWQKAPVYRVCHKLVVSLSLTSIFMPSVPDVPLSATSPVVCGGQTLTQLGLGRLSCKYVSTSSPHLGSPAHCLPALSSGFGLGICISGQFCTVLRQR